MSKGPRRRAIAGAVAAIATIVAPGTPAVAQAPSPPAASPACDSSLWKHVYEGDHRRFGKPQDRLQVVDECVVVTGTIESARPEPDGDIHIRLRLDPQFADMINSRNRSGQHGDLVLEPVCVNQPTQRDTIDEHACDGFNQTFDRSLVGQHVQVVGAYVTDMEHGWNEVHPVTSIAPAP